MKFTTIVSTALLFAASAYAGDTVTYDQTYDNPSGSTATVACSNGVHGLEGRFPTFGSFPKFPFIGGAPAVAGFDSPNCGTCWNLAFNGTSINVLAIDHSTSFNIALAAMNKLTNGNAVQLGRVPVTASQVATSQCGL